MAGENAGTCTHYQEQTCHFSNIPAKLDHTENIKEKVYQNFKTIIELNNSNTEIAHSICSRLLYTVLFDIASCIEGNPNNSKANLIKPCIDYIKSNYMHDISISALAEMIKVTPTYLGIIFKKVYNITPQKFLTNIRIEKSKQLLVSNKNSHFRMLQSIPGLTVKVIFATHSRNI